MPDRAYLQEALRVADRFLKLINENVRLKENVDRLEWMQYNIQNDLNITFNSLTNKLGQRKLLHYGSLTKVRNKFTKQVKLYRTFDFFQVKSGKELVGFLLNDFFMLVQPSKSLGATQFSFQRNSNIIYKMYRQVGNSFALKKKNTAVYFAAYTDSRFVGE